MILISHRGNVDGVDKEKENHPEYIDRALKFGFDVEIDVWYINDKFYSGHDEPQYEVDYEWLFLRKENLWIHCKNTDCVTKLLFSGMNYFWHEEDTLTLTSKGYIWVYPGKQPIKNSIAVLPEIFNDDISSAYGICSDVITNYKNRT